MSEYEKPQKIQDNAVGQPRFQPYDTEPVEYNWKELDAAPSNVQHYMVLVSIVPLIIQVIVLCVLFFVFTYYYTRSYSCSNNREIWCKDSWYCVKQTTSTDKVYNKCYQLKDHLASCLFGPDSTAAVKCIDYSKKGVACPCSLPDGSTTDKAGNCMAGCPSSIDKISKNTVCCCKPETSGCPNKILPPQCS